MRTAKSQAGTQARAGRGLPRGEPQGSARRCSARTRASARHLKRASTAPARTHARRIRSAPRGATAPPADARLPKAVMPSSVSARRRSAGMDGVIATVMPSVPAISCAQTMWAQHTAGRRRPMCARTTSTATRTSANTTALARGVRPTVKMTSASGARTAKRTWAPNSDSLPGLTFASIGGSRNILSTTGADGDGCARRRVR